MAEVMLVSEIMTRNVKTVRLDTTVREVIATMLSREIGSIVVVQGERPVGIITERDILRAVMTTSIPIESFLAKDAMSTPLITINAHASIDEATRLMKTKRVKKLVVVDDGKLTGILTHTDVVYHVPEMFRTLEELLRPRRNR